MQQIGKNLYFLRISNKTNKFYSQKDISELFHIPQTHISRFENGKEIVRLLDIISYSIFFDVSTDDIIFKKYNSYTKEFENIQR